MQIVFISFCFSKKKAKQLKGSDPEAAILVGNNSNIWKIV